MSSVTLVAPDGVTTRAVSTYAELEHYLQARGYVPQSGTVSQAFATVTGIDPSTPPVLPTPGSELASDPALRAAFGLSIVATVSASATLAVGKHTPVDATAAARTMTLPTGAGDGVTIGVEKVDASVNVVSITGNIRGVPATAVTLPWQHETLLLRADATGSWWPVAGHKTKGSLDAAYVPAVVIPPSGDTTGATDTARWQAAINAAIGTGRVLSPVPDAAYYINAPLVVTPTNTGTSNVPQQAPSIFCMGGPGRIGDEQDTTAGTRFIATATFPLGAFLLDYQQVGSVYGTNGARVGGFTLECSSRAAGFRAQGPRQFHVSDMSIVGAIAPVNPGDGSNGAFSIPAVANGGNAAAYSLFERITVWCAQSGTGDAFWDSTNGENTYSACRALASPGGASYHVARDAQVNSTAQANHAYIDCHYAAGTYGVLMDKATSAAFIGLSLFNNSPWPTKNALRLDNGWQYNQPAFYPPVFIGCRFINSPGAGVTEADGAIVRFVNSGTAYNIDAVFSACYFGAPGTHTSDYVYSDTGITAGGVVTFRDCTFNGTPTVRKINDQSQLVRFYNCKGINPLGSTVAQPAIAATGTAVTNQQGTDCTVFVTGGTVSSVSIGGTVTGLTSGAFRVPAGQTITLAYSAAPTWTWFGD